MKRRGARRLAPRHQAPKRQPPRPVLPGPHAGTGLYLGPEEFTTLLVQENEATRQASFCVPVSGDSMEPRYHHGDLLMIDAGAAPGPGDIGLFTVDGEGYVKACGAGCLVSLNPAYPSIPLTEDTRCNGKVIGVLKPDWVVEK